jgi:hypothetical protein
MTSRARSYLLILAFCAAVAAFPGSPLHAQETAPPPFGPPLQYTPKPGQEFKTLLAANISWLKNKLRDRKRRRREAQNSFRLEPAATKPQVQATIDQLDKEIAETQAALNDVKKPDAQPRMIKDNVEAWIKALNERADNFRNYAEEADQKAKMAVKQLDAAKYRFEADEDRKTAQNVENTVKALAQDLRTAGL